MSVDDDLYYLRHMLEYAVKIVELMEGRDRANYNADETLRVTLLHWLQVIGEAATHVSDEFQMAHPAIPWRAIIAMRNRIVHDYLGIDEEIVWQTVALRVPELIDQLKGLLPPPGSENSSSPST